MDTTTVDGAKQVEYVGKMNKGDAKQVSNDSSKERQKKLSTNSDKKSIKINSKDITTKTKTNIEISKNNKVNDVQVMVSNLCYMLSLHNYTNDLMSLYNRYTIIEGNNISYRSENSRK